MNRTARFLIPLVFLAGCCGDRDDQARWLDLEIEIPKEEKRRPWYEILSENWKGEPDENGMFTNSYLVHPGFFRMRVGGGGGGSAAPDPFAVPEDFSIFRYPRRLPPKAALEAYGVAFEEGASATYNVKAMTLTVTQTPDQMELVEAVVQSIRWHTERSISIQIEIFELPEAIAARLERGAGKPVEHGAEYEAVLDLVRDREARIVTTARLLARSGQRARYEDSEEILRFHGYESRKTKEGEEEAPLPDFAAEKVGTVVEADPVLGPDDRTIDLNLLVNHHLGPPEWPDGRTPVFRVGSFTRNFTVVTGQCLLAGSWAVPSKDESGNRLRRLVFVTSTVVRS